MNLSGARIVGLAARAVLALVIIGCAAPAYNYAEVATLRTSSPVQACKLAPHDATALGNCLGSRFESNPEYKPSAGDLSEIRAALRAQPLEPKLLSITGLAYEANGHPQQAAEVMRVANRVSRHDSVSGLYLIEFASTSGSTAATLRHYNTLLLTQPALNGTLLPILSSAIVYPEVREGLRPFISSDVRWMPQFLTIASKEADVPDLLALLLPLPKNLLNEVYRPTLAGVLRRVAVEGDRSSAILFAEAIVPGFSASTLVDLGVSPSLLDTRLGQFSWSFSSLEGFQVDIVENKSIVIEAKPLASGIVASRELLLVGGTEYEFLQQVKYGIGTGRINAKWSADCVTANSSLHIWEQRLPSLKLQGTYRSTFVVPSQCKVVRVTLFANSPDGQMPANLTITNMRLAKLKATT